MVFSWDRSIAIRFPKFEPHPLFRGGHAQTLAGAYLPGRVYPYRARQHRVPLDDGDQLVLHDDRPAKWRDGDPAAVLIHGLGGSHQSCYMQRIAGRLVDRGVRALRLDLRGAGAGAPLARLPYHSGRSDDAAAAVRYATRLCPDSPLTVVGFSLGGNIVLKLLGEIGAGDCGNLVAGVAVSPPVELATCCQRIQERGNHLYNRRFVEALLRQHRQRMKLVPGALAIPFARNPRSLLELDDRFTGPINGFGNAANYYHQSSSAQFVPDIRKPTLIIAAADDPLIPVEIYKDLQLPKCVLLHISHRGGHLGFISRAGADPDRRWLDWRIIEWLLPS